VLRDLLQDDSEIDDKYYLSEKGIKYIEKRENKYTQILDKDAEYCPAAIIAVGNANWTGNFIQISKSVKPCVAKNFQREKEKIQNSNKEIYQCVCESGFNDNKCGLKTSPTIRALNDCVYAYTGKVIRKLTQKECFRLMDFSDNDYENARKALNDTYYKGKDKSGSQLYKQAGNSIVVAVLEAIFKEML
jgi:site-specific DNA-cytosine methylase